MASGLIPETPTAWIGYAIAIVTVLVAYFRDRRKGDIDESALVLGKWKELVEQHQSDIKGIREEFNAYKLSAAEETRDLRARLQTAEKRIVELETENTGLKRAIAQNSQSTAYQLGRRGNDPGHDAALRKLDDTKGVGE